jgi:hypothetical protein
MKTEKKSDFGMKSKAEIGRKMNSFLKKMTDSKNDFERLGIVDDLDQILDSEIDAWLRKLEESQDRNDKESDAIFNESAKHINDLQESKLKLNDLRLQFVPGAKKLWDVLQRQNKNLSIPKTLKDEK